MLKEVIIYTDGACANNPGPGGWAAILICGEHIKELYGGESVTTNNKMELTAAIKALETLKQPCHVKLYSDSAYLINAFKQRWMDKWIRNGWKTVEGNPVENRELWQKLMELSKIHQIEWLKVKGHSDNQYNNRCDKLAKDALKQINGCIL